MIENNDVQRYKTGLIFNIKPLNGVILYEVILRLNQSLYGPEARSLRPGLIPRLLASVSVLTTPW